MKIISSIINFSLHWKSFTSNMMKLLLRMNGATIGKNTFISASSRIVSNKLIIGKDCTILENVKIKAGELIIGDGVIISSDSLFTGVSKLSIGDKTYLGKKARIDLSREVKIGKDVGFGENSIIWTHGYFPPADEGYPVTYAPVTIEDGAWVSTSIIVLPGVTVGKKSIIGAGSVLTRNVPEGMIVAGNPGKIIKEVKEILIDKEYIKILEDIFDQYKKEALLNKSISVNYIKYDFAGFSIHITDGNELFLSDIDKQKRNIILFKNIMAANIKVTKTFYWFDLDNKIRMRSKYKELNSLAYFLHGYGMRFLIED